MRFLHTSDWHLGRTFHGASLIDEQREAVERIVALAGEYDVDLVVIAGDLYDRAIPPAEAVRLFDDALVDLRATGAAVVAISGNHDSAARVSVHDRLLEAAGVSIRGDLERLDRPIAVTTRDGGPPVLVYPLPYLEPKLVTEALRPAPPVESEAADTADRAAAGTEPSRRRAPSQADVTLWATDRMRRDLASRGPARSILVAHTFVVGGAPTESEKEILVGGLGHVPLDVFHGFDYVALGHLHREQAFEHGRIAYSGTPLPYSFSEEGHAKSVRIVELTPDGQRRVETVPLGVGRPLRTLRGTLRDLLEAPAYADAETARVRAILTDEMLPTQAMARLRGRFPHAAELRHEPPQQDVARSRATDAVNAGVAPEVMAESFWGEVAGHAPSEQVRTLLAEALAASRRGDAS